MLEAHHRMVGRPTSYRRSCSRWRSRSRRHLRSAHAARRDPRPVRRAGHRLHRVDGQRRASSRTRSPIRSSPRCSRCPARTHVRGHSMFGMSFVYVIFEDGTDIYWARSRVLEYLNGVAGASCPTGVTPTLGPDATASAGSSSTRSSTRPGKHDLAELRSSRTGTCATRSAACRASPRSRASAASSSSTRSASTRRSCSRYGITLHERDRARSALEQRRRRTVDRDRGARVHRARPRLRARRSPTSRTSSLGRDGGGHADPRARRRRGALGPAHPPRRRRARRRGRGRRRHRRHALRRERARRHRGRQGASSPSSSRRCRPASRSSPTYDRSTLIERAIATLQQHADRGDRSSSRWSSCCSCCTSAAR